MRAGRCDRFALADAVTGCFLISTLADCNVPPMRFKMNKNKATVCLFFLAALALPLTIKIVWWKLDGGMSHWDDSFYLDESIALRDALATKGIGAFWDQFLMTSIRKGPLMSLQPVPVYFLLGRQIQSAELINAGFIVIMSIYLFLLCNRFWPWPVGIIAIVTTSMCPMLYGLCNFYMRDYQFAVYVLATAYHLHSSNGLIRFKHIFILGILLGFGTLLGAIYPILVAPLYLITFVMTISRGRTSRSTHNTPNNMTTKRLGLNCISLLVITAMIAGPWYFHNWKSVLNTSLDTGYGWSADHVGSRNIFSWSVIEPYLRYTIIINGISTWQFYVGCGCFIGCLIALYRQKLYQMDIFPKEAVLLLSAWIVPFFLFLFAVSKEARYAAPFFPVFGIILAALIWGARRAFRGAWVLIALGYVPTAFICLYSLFGLGSGTFAEKFLNHYRAGGDYAVRPEMNRWPHLEIINFIRDHHPTHDSKNIQVAVITDSPELNHYRLNLIADLNYAPISFRTSVYMSNQAQILEYLTYKDFLLGQRGAIKRSFFDDGTSHNVALQAVKEGFFERVECPIRLPDGTELELWRRTAKTKTSQSDRF